MTDRMKSLVFFPTIHHLFRLEKELHERGIASRPVPAPRHLTADCATVLEIDHTNRPRVEAVLAETGIPFTELHDV